MLTVSCREVGMDCDYVCKGETEEEIMKTAEEHAIRDHGYKPEDLMTPELREKIRSHIKQSQLIDSFIFWMISLGSAVESPAVYSSNRLTLLTIF